MNKRTTTQWTTTTKRTTRGNAPDNIDAELDHILADCRWNAVIRDVEQMPLGLARKLRDRLDTIFEVPRELPLNDNTIALLGLYALGGWMFYLVMKGLK